MQRVKFYRIDGLGYYVYAYWTSDREIYIYRRIKV